MSDPFSELDKKIEQARHGQPLSEEEQQGKDLEENKKTGLHAGLELVGSIVVSGALGYALDQYFETAPLFLLIFFFLGVATGFYNVYRVTQNMGTSVGNSQLHQPTKNAKQSPDE